MNRLNWQTNNYHLKAPRKRAFGDFEDKYEIGEEVKVYYYPNSEDGSNENTLSHSIVFSR